MRPTARIGAPPYAGEAHHAPRLVLLRDRATASPSGQMATLAAPTPPRLLGAVGVVLTLGLVVVVGVIVSTIVALQLV